MQRVLVLSYYNDPNFGDRLGYHIVNGILPPDVEVHHASVVPWSVPDHSFDLLVLGIGNSLNAATIRRDELFRLIERIPLRVGFFGMQYRGQYEWALPPGRLNQLFDSLTIWFARYRQDLLRFGKARSNARHLGDMLITAFPMTRWSDPRTLVIPAEIKSKPIALDRLIQQIQRHRRVKSFRLHPLLCALTSADQVAYVEQTEDPRGEASGKFDAMLMDIFGARFEAETFVDVDREKVAGYKMEVARNLESARLAINDLLGQGQD